jgi:hypothetical protein
MRAGRGDILTEIAPRPHCYRFPHLKENELSRNSHPFTECSGRQESLPYSHGKVGMFGGHMWVQLTCSPPLLRCRTPRRSLVAEGFDGIEVRGADGREYLGASPSKKSVARLREKVNDVLTPRNTDPWPDVCTRLNHLLRGWSGYFSYGSLRRAYQAIDHHVAERVRQFLGRRRQKPTRGTRTLSDEVIFGPLGVLRFRHVPPAVRP